MAVGRGRVGLGVCVGVGRWRVIQRVGFGLVESGKVGVRVGVGVLLGHGRVDFGVWVGRGRVLIMLVGDGLGHPMIVSAGAGVRLGLTEGVDVDGGVMVYTNPGTGVGVGKAISNDTSSNAALCSLVRVTHCHAGRQTTVLTITSTTGP